MNPMSLLTMPTGLLRESQRHAQSGESSHGEPHERQLALAISLVGMLAAVVIVFA